MKSNVRSILKEHRFNATAAGAAIGLSKGRANRKANGETAWTVPEIVALYNHLRDEGAKVKLDDLVLAAVKDLEDFNG